MIDRRVAFVSLALALLTSPLVAGAQQAGKVPQIGLIRPGSPPDPFAEAFLQGLRDLGYVEGRTIAIAYRWAEGKTDRIPALAEELSRLKVEVIVTGDIQVAKRVTSTIPVVSPTMNEPVEEGLVASLARPGGHITGLSLMSPELNAKRLELLKETFPQVSRVAVLHDPRVTPADLQATEAAARTLGLHLQIFEVRSLDDLETAFVAATQARADAVHILNSSFFAANRVRIVEVVRQTQLPATYPTGCSLRPAGSCPMGHISQTCSGAPPPMWTKSSRVPIPATCRWSNRYGSNWSSTSRLPRHSASRLPRRCSSRQTR